VAYVALHRISDRLLNLGILHEEIVF